MLPFPKSELEHNHLTLYLLRTAFVREASRLIINLKIVVQNTLSQ